jgi:hypothetical protein
MQKTRDPSDGIATFAIACITAPLALWLWWMNLPEWHWYLRLPAALLLAFLTGRLIAGVLVLPFTLVGAVLGMLNRWRGQRAAS